MPKAVPLWFAGVMVLLIVMGAVAGVWIWRMGLPGAGSSSYTNQQGSQAQQGQPPEFPRMQLQGQYAGPIQGTVIQRWRDPVDGTICYIYLPMVVQHTPAPAGYVQYGANAIGSISCMPVNAPAAAPAGK